ncbi:sulfite exporter TauE/SafE family protein [Thermus sp.]|uniref:sulfite exporter TauE/SafE family protein n=1 Tax=Thermus sp. TaxID=275 RepID=UPI00307D6929
MLGMALGLFVLSLVSGMLGLGVAFAAVPFLSFFLEDLVHQVQPLALLLNGVTAAFAVVGFAQSRLLDWRKGLVLALVTTLFAPLGAWWVQAVPVRWVWFLYLGAVVYLAFNLFRPSQRTLPRENFPLALLLAVPIAVVAGFLGVGSGFLLFPALVLTGHEPKRAAAINALAVTPSSFSSLIPHLATARLDPALTLALVLAGAVGSYLGSRFTGLYLPPHRMRQLFGLLIVAATFYRVYTFLS